MKRLLLLLFLVPAYMTPAQTVKILFDASQAEMAGNADWVLDADLFNLGVKTGGLMATGYGNEANAQRYPTPVQSNITSTTAETFWKGGLSAWGVGLAKLGFQVETLPYNGLITYNNSTNPQDLKNYKVFVMCEPNIKLTTAEKSAILNFVNAGGGFFMISDHNNSDRNNDGWDSPQIFNDLMTSNGVINNPFGMIFDYTDFSQTTSNFNSALTADPILYGPQGNPSQMKFSNGTSMTISSTANSSVKGIVYKTGLAKSTAGVMMAHAHYGAGKVVGLGDSSPADDGTGDTNDALYCGWSCEVNGDHARILLNATLWLTTTTASPYRTSVADVNPLQFHPNPAQDKIYINSAGLGKGLEVSITDMTGRVVLRKHVENNAGTVEMDIEELATGNYLIMLAGSSVKKTARFIKN